MAKARAAGEVNHRGKVRRQGLSVAPESSMRTITARASCKREVSGCRPPAAHETLAETQEGMRYKNERKRERGL